ncbi:hypothetical protein C0989_003483 [Termitomyces sp. Mn162]|nr:hypothetical protein C0989_003483 [Termitomyces sp. Mn162]
MNTPHLERRGSNPPIKILAGGKEIDTKPFAKGGGRPYVIKKDQVFAGRTQGGGTRKQIYGTRVIMGVVWANPFPIDGAAAYLHPTEYGLPDNTTRPGGPLATLTYVSSTSPNSTFRVLTDLASAEALISSLSVCSSFINLTSPNPSPYLEYSASPLPEQTLQYYRASSVALTLDDYNNTAVLLPTDSPSSYNVLLPSDTDVKLLHCLNTTIGSAVLLYDPKGLSGDQIFLIVTGCIFSVVLGALLVPFLCGLSLQSCRRHRHRPRCRPRPQEPRRKLSKAPPIPCVINPINAPPAAVIVLPLNVEPLSSGKAGELIEEDDDVASLTKNAQGFAGTQYDKPVDRHRPTPWRWVPSGFGGRNSKVSQDIEMKGKN